MKRLYILLLILLGLTPALRAEVLTLDSCLAMARQRNCTIQSAELEVAMSEEVKKQVLWKYFPQVSIGSFAFHGYNPLIRYDLSTSNLGMLTDLYNGLNEMVKEQYGGREIDKELRLLEHGLAANMRLVQPVFWGGQIVNGNRLAKLGIDASRLKAELTERDLLQQVEESYWLVVGLLDKRQTVQRSLALLDSIQEMANVAFGSGLVTRNDLLRVQLKHSEIDTKALQLENGIHLASRALCQLIGLEYTQELELESFRAMELSDTLATLVPFNIEDRPETKLLDMQIKAEQLRKKITLGESLPHIGFTLMGGYTNYSSLTQSPGYWNGTTLAFLSIPLTGWGETAHKLKQHDLSIRKAELMREDLRGKLSLQNEQTYNSLTESVRLMLQHSNDLVLAEDNYRIATMNYAAGLITMTELLEAEAMLLLAENAYTDARISYRAALRKFNDYNSVQP